jgi:hypothetical protein
MTSQPSDDELWKNSQWDPTDVAESRYRDQDCSIHDFNPRLQALMRHLKSQRLGPSTNRDILELARSTSESWWRYVDPAMSRSSGTIDSTAIVLYECTDHVFTLRYKDGKWYVLKGEHTSDISDEFDNSLDLEQLEMDGALDTLFEVSDESETTSDVEPAAEPPLIDLLEDEDIELAQIREIKNESDVRALEQAEKSVIDETTNQSQQLDELQWEVDNLRLEIDELHRQIDSLMRQNKILQNRLNQRSSRT